MTIARRGLKVKVKVRLMRSVRPRSRAVFSCSVTAQTADAGLGSRSSSTSKPSGMHSNQSWDKSTSTVDTVMQRVCLQHY